MSILTANALDKVKCALVVACPQIFVFEATQWVRNVWVNRQDFISDIHIYGARQGRNLKC
jgi:hypothetical protein